MVKLDIVYFSLCSQVEFLATLLRSAIVSCNPNVQKLILKIASICSTDLLDDSAARIEKLIIFIN